MVALYQHYILTFVCREEKQIFTFLVFLYCNDNSSISTKDQRLCDRYLNVHPAIEQALERLQQL